LFRLLAAGQIEPAIAARFPILEAAQANALLESGQVTGNVMLAIQAKMDAADGLLLASPVYVDDVSGLTKTWMDRLAYLCHRPGFGGKCAYPVATVGGSPTCHTLRTMNAALLTWGATIWWDRQASIGRNTGEVHSG
jgi:multimeric flavodoxin WrbA